MIIHIDKEEVTILEIKIVTLGEKDTHAYNYRLERRTLMHIIIERIRSG